MTKKKQTFADRARALEKKYKNYENDPVVKQDFLNELRQLRAEQEEFKASQEMPEEDLQEFKKGGIYIKPSKRGTFTRAAKSRGMGVQEFASKVLSAPEGRYSAAMRKKANFARNASRWKKACGGRLMKQEGGEIPYLTPRSAYVAPGRGREIPSLIPRGTEVSTLPGQGLTSVGIPEILSGENVGTPSVGGTPYTTFENQAYLPAAGSFAATVAGNIPYLTAKGEEIDLTPLMAREISDARNRELAKRRAETSRIVNLRQAAQQGRLSDVGAVNAAIDRALGEQLTRSYGQEERLNMAERARVEAMNARREAQEQMFNVQQRQRAKDLRRAGVQGIALGATQALGDITQGQREAQLLNSMISPSGYRVLYNPESGTYETVFTGEGSQAEIVSPTEFRKRRRS